MLGNEGQEQQMVKVKIQQMLKACTTKRKDVHKYNAKESTQGRYHKAQQT